MPAFDLTDVELSQVTACMFSRVTPLNRATSAPLIAGDLVISGISGGDEGVRGFLSAYRAATGERVWTSKAIPDRSDQEANTWIGKSLEHGCGSTWLTGTYDTATDTLLSPIGNPCPDFNGDERKGDDLYTDSVVALEPLTGKRNGITKMANGTDGFETALNPWLKLFTKIKTP